MGVALSPLRLRESPKNIRLEFGLEGVESKEVSGLPLEEVELLEQALEGVVGRGVGMEGVCGSVGDCWKGLGIGSTLKCLPNLELGGGRSPKNVKGV